MYPRESLLLVLTTWTARSNGVSPGSVVESTGRGASGGERERRAALLAGEEGGLLVGERLIVWVEEGD